MLYGHHTPLIASGYKKNTKSGVWVYALWSPYPAHRFQIQEKHEKRGMDVSSVVTIPRSLLPDTRKKHKTGYGCKFYGHHTPLIDSGYKKKAKSGVWM